MDEVEVDPKLFVTCRLCLEDLGQYQIVPSIQQQIRYCFEIEVDSFDGLPQLICMKCKQILNDFHNVKKTYSEKQTKLKNKSLKKDEICPQPQQDTVSSSQQITENIDNPETSKSAKKRSLPPSSSSESDCEQSHLQHTKPKRKKKTLRLRKDRVRWETGYNKQIACKLCYTFWSSKRSLSNHHRSHDLLKSKYKNIFERQCTVLLEKIDGKPNITGNNNSVVHSSQKIIVHGNSYYYTVYIKETEQSSDFAKNSEENERVSLLRNALKQESTDDDEKIISRSTQRKRRILSRSSNDTVVIESNVNKLSSDNEMDPRISTYEGNDQQSFRNEQCINIDDSTDSEAEGKLDSSQKGKQPMVAKLGDYKIIQGIISMCVNAYRKKYESTDVDLHANTTQNKKNDKAQEDSKSQLKHKILSIGRKIINKQGFNCTGLLRYMEHKNLEIIWLSKISSCTRETNYIRILTKLRGSDMTNENLGWVKVTNIAAAESSNRVKGHDTPPSSETSYVANTSKSQIAIKETNQLTKNEPSHTDQVKEQFNSDTMAAMLYIDNNASTSDPKKLLNANPVANPKQLPKKLGCSTESRISKSTAQPSTSMSHTNNDDKDFCMPIITSTTSLAVVPNKDQTQDDNGNNKTNSTSEIVATKETPAAPWIKVKPASELMSERILNSIMKEQSSAAAPNSNMLTCQAENAWSQPQPINSFVPNLAPQIHVSSQPMQIVQMPCLTPVYQVIQPTPTTSNFKQDYVILDTPQFPNTKTECPFQYLKDLLQLHNIVLLDPCDDLPREFNCLIKFKVLFKQEAHKDKPVVLCLGIFNCRNRFCLKVKDRNQEHIGINKISANWQWEILQIYRGNVVQKVLHNAQKISNETFYFTNTFFCVLKSINIKKMF